MSSRNDSEEEVWGDILDKDEKEDEEDKEMKQPDEEGGNEEEEMLQEEEEEEEEEEKVLVDASNIPGFMTSSSPCSSGVRRDPREAEASVGVGVGRGRVCKGVLCLGFVVRVNWKGY
ncbi:hypothetical protein Pmani_033399 [Petrolisthes manimaculis]|uniref:Uncharacterized protein n=1 Tax=Petrolisthes manimaculis TaxID=1843537 RepID=A0AAE1NRX3_9EUCA|nr:hypothetical protein Pmani_033399 [Petrolisthes manimaculis]